LARRFGAAEGDFVDFFMQIGDNRSHGIHVGLKIGRARVKLGFQDSHVASLFLFATDVQTGVTAAFLP
jgi:hypothetical protein